MKIRMIVELKECPSCGRTKDKNGKPLKHGGKGNCKACYIKARRASKGVDKDA